MQEPQIGDKVRATMNGEEWESRHRYTGESLEYRSGGPDGKSSRLITHWMPIPKAPNAE